MCSEDKKQPQEVEANGLRNVFCPYYNACLDNAVRKKLPGWDCTRCVYKNVIEPIDPSEAERCKNLLHKAFNRTPETLVKLISRRLVKLNSH